MSRVFAHSLKWRGFPTPLWRTGILWGGNAAEGSARQQHRDPPALAVVSQLKLKHRSWDWSRVCWQGSDTENGVAEGLAAREVGRSGCVAFLWVELILKDGLLCFALPYTTPSPEAAILWQTRHFPSVFHWSSLKRGKNQKGFSVWQKVYTSLAHSIVFLPWRLCTAVP